MAEGLVACSSFGTMLPKSQLHMVTDEDSQGYEPHQLVCHQCLADIRYEGFQLEDEDLEE